MIPILKSICIHLLQKVQGIELNISILIDRIIREVNVVYATIKSVLIFLLILLTYLIVAFVLTGGLLYIFFIYFDA